MGTAKLQDQYFSSANQRAMKHQLIEEAVNHERACPNESLLDSTRDLLHDLQDGYWESRSQEDPISSVICRKIPITARMSLTSDMWKMLSFVTVHWSWWTHLITHLGYCCGVCGWLSDDCFSCFFFTENLSLVIGTEELFSLFAAVCWMNPTLFFALTKNL